MNRWVGVAAAGLIALVPACEKHPGKPAAAVPSPATGPNAADVYRAAWAKIDGDLSRAAGFVSFDAAGMTLTPGSEYADVKEVQGLLRSRQEVVAELLKAGSMGSCDFGLKIDLKHPEKDMPVLLAAVDSMRNSARLLRADAARAWVGGDTDGAVDRVVAIYALCMHASDEPVIVVALTNAAVLGLANDTAEKMVAGAGGTVLSATQRARLLAALERLDRGDPAGIIRARKAEGDRDATAGQTVQLKLTSELAKLRRELAGN